MFIFKKLAVFLTVLCSSVTFAAIKPYVVRDFFEIPKPYVKRVVVEAETTFAPNVPSPIKRDKHAHVYVDFHATEVTKELDDGVNYHFWTFDGVVPGKFIRVRQGDLVEFSLHNDKDSKMPHNIDLHAVTGPGGGASVSNTSLVIHLFLLLKL